MTRSLRALFVLGLFCLILIALAMISTKPKGGVMADAKSAPLEAFVKLRDKTLKGKEGRAYYGLGMSTQKVDDSHVRIDYAIAPTMNSGGQTYTVELTPLKVTLLANGQRREELAGQSATLNSRSSAANNVNDGFMSGTVFVSANNDANAVIIKCTPLNGKFKKVISHIAKLQNVISTSAIFVMNGRHVGSAVLDCERVTSTCEPDPNSCGTMECCCDTNGGISTSCVDCFIQCTECTCS